MKTNDKVIGQWVNVTIDRPLGSRHPEFPDMIYPINYGYVEGIMSGDGEEQDAYILGIEDPLETFRGKVIAIIHRLDDLEDKWVVADDSQDYSDDEIMKLVGFQEQYFKSFIIRE